MDECESEFYACLSVLLRLTDVYSHSIYVFHKAPSSAT